MTTLTLVVTIYILATELSTLGEQRSSSVNLNPNHDYHFSVTEHFTLHIVHFFETDALIGQI